MRNTGSGRAFESVAAGCLLLALLAGAAIGEDYAITLDGKTVELYPISPHAPRRPAREGDVVEIGGHLVTLGPPGKYRYHGGRSRLLLKTDEGSTVVAVAFRYGERDGKRSLINPLDGLEPESIRKIRGLLPFPSEGVAVPGIEHLDAEKVVLTFDEIAHRRPVPALPHFPPATGHLVINLHYNLRFGSSTVKDFRSLESLTKLRYLMAEGPDSVFDLAWIEKNRSLRHLNLHGSKILNPKLLASFPELDTLCLRWGAIRDLSGIEKLGKLRRLHLEFSRVRALPLIHLPALEELHTTGSEMTDEAVIAFLELNPQCRSFRGYGALLEQALEGVTRVRISDHERTIELTGKEVAELLAAIAIHEKSSSDDFTIGGPDVSVALFRGDESAGAFRLTVGSWIEWPEALPGTAHLADASAEAVCESLARGGHPGPKRQRLAYLASEGPEFRRWALYDRQLPAYLYRWCMHGDWSRLALEFKTTFPDPTQRAYACFRLLGLDEGSWHLDVGIDRLIVLDVLPGIHPRNVSRALLAVGDDDRTLTGAGRWLFGEGKLGGIDPTTRRKVLVDIARRALAHPRRINRQRTMLALAALGSRAALRLLKDVRDGKIAIRPLAREEMRERDYPAHWQEGLPEERDIDDRTLARELLDAKKR